MWIGFQPEADEDQRREVDTGCLLPPPAPDCQRFQRFQNIVKDYQPTPRWDCERAKAGNWEVDMNWLNLDGFSVQKNLKKKCRATERKIYLRKVTNRNDNIRCVGFQTRWHRHLPHLILFITTIATVTIAGIYDNSCCCLKDRTIPHLNDNLCICCYDNRHFRHKMPHADQWSYWPPWGARQRGSWLSRWPSCLCTPRSGCA